MTREVQAADAIGIGIGPSNLSTAALLAPVAGLRCEMFERKPAFQWHGGLLFEDATLQVSFLKDLVTLVDPTSKYSFLAFLAAHGRLYRFVSAQFGAVLRREFDQYYRWVAGQLDTLHFGREVRAVGLDRGSLVVELDDRRIVTKKLILGTGLAPRVPACAQPHLGATVFHAFEYLHHRRDLTGLSVAVIGGGQSGAEIVSRILAGDDGRPRELGWYSRRPSFMPLDDSAFQNELFTPSYSEYFHRLPQAHRRRMIDEQTLTSDGISSSLLQRIYQQLYALQHLHGDPTAGGARSGATRVHLRPGRRLVELRPGRSLPSANETGGAMTLVFDGEPMALREHATADVVVLATGQDYQLPRCLEPLRSRIAWESSGLPLAHDFSLVWDAPPGVDIYVHNGGRLSHGVADPNLSLGAYRSARIVNALLGREHYRLAEAPLVDWPSPARPERATAHSSTTGATCGSPRPAEPSARPRREPVP